MCVCEHFVTLARDRFGIGLVLIKCLQRSALFCAFILNDRELDSLPSPPLSQNSPGAKE